MNIQLRTICWSLALATVLLDASHSNAAETTRVSVNSAGAQGNLQSRNPSTSADGRYVAFFSLASNLVPGDTNNTLDVFVRDRLAGTISRASFSSAGAQANDESFDPSISADGRYVAFGSSASNLVPGDTNNNEDIFVRDRLAGTTSRVSVSSAGAQGNNLSKLASISADGRYVAFESIATNLVPGDTNGTSDVFVRDRLAGTTSRVSVSSAGAQGNDESFDPSISADGRYVAFVSSASNLVPVDTNNNKDIFIRDRLAGTTSRVSFSSTGAPGNNLSENPSISADGRYVAFVSSASNLVPGDTNGLPDIFVRDRLVGTTTRVSVSSAGVQGNNMSERPSISADGRYVAFGSIASSLVPGDTNSSYDVFLRDRLAGTTSRASFSSAGAQGNEGSNLPSISADGRYVVFISVASNLVPGDTNSSYDVFVRDRLLNKSLSADIQTSVYSKPASVTKGATASYIFIVRNNGPSSASSVSLTDVISRGTAISLTPSQGTCSKAAVSVCRFGTLAPGAFALVTVKIKADANPLTQLLSVSAAELDNVPANNRGTVTTPVTP